MSGHKTIYLADDDYEDRMLLTEALRTIDPEIRILEAENGAVLLEIMQNPLPTAHSLVILDMNMPRMNGLETLVSLRANSLLSSIPIVMVSTTNQTESVALAKHLGAMSYFSKPTRITALLELARKLIAIIS